MATNETMKKEFALFSEIWNFFKKFYEVRESEAYWEDMMQQAGEIMKRHDSPLCNAVILAVIEELERKGSRL